jgi:23S rRNA (guanosine2251-2'-O)-methyltransferase
MKSNKNSTAVIYIILHNVRSVENVGSIFRTADAVGVSKIFLTGYTPAPIDRFGRERRDIHKSALGAEKTVDWEQYESWEKCFSALKEQGVHIVAVEQSKKSVDYKIFSCEGNVAFVFGNEVEGLSKDILEKADVVLEVPMLGKKESLNVSVAVGVVLYRILDS